MAGPLEGVTIIDVCRAGPGQMATGILSDYGAGVITIVEPGHAQSRAQYGAVRPGFGRVGRRNKRSMLLNLRAEGALDIFMKMVRRVDAVMESNRPGAARRLGVDYESVCKVNPSIVYCSLTGYGQYGPYKDLAGHDLSFQAVGGRIPLDEEGNPVMPPYNDGDLNAMWNGALALLMGLLHRSKTGKGQFIDVAFSDSSITLPPGRQDDEGLRGFYPAYQIYQTKDGKYINLSIREPWFWERMCKLLGREEWIPHIRPQGELRDQMFAHFQEFFRSKTQAEWVKILAEHDIQFSPVNRTVEEVVSDPHNRARGMILETKDPFTGEPRHQVGFALKFAETPAVLRRGATIIGSDTEEILQELGYAEKAILELKAKGVVAWET